RGPPRNEGTFSSPAQKAKQFLHPRSPRTSGAWRGGRAPKRAEAAVPGRGSRWRSTFGPPAVVVFVDPSPRRHPGCADRPSAHPEHARGIPSPRRGPKRSTRGSRARGGPHGDGGQRFRSVPEHPIQLGGDLVLADPAGDGELLDQEVASGAEHLALAV